MYFDNVWKWKHKATTTKETGYEHMIDSLNIISVDNFKKLSDEEQKPYVAEVMKRIRDVNIFPIYYYNEKGIRDEILRCIVTEPLKSSKPLIQHNTAGLTLLDFMFPNLHRVVSGSVTNGCMYDRFYNDERLARCITRHMKNYKFTNMRSPFFMYGRFFWSTAVNFNPTRARAICEMFCEPGGTVYDYSCGFGARMLGTLASNKNAYRYVGCEPAHDTYHNLNRLGEYIESVTGRKDSYEIFNTGSECFTPESNSIDFAFSCPPYYRLERYCDEATQSVEKFNTYDKWLEGYVKETLNNVYVGLKPGKLLGIVINDVYYAGRKYNLQADWSRIAEEQGFEFVEAYPINTRSRKQDGSVETLYIFKSRK